jgi:hypothetical protein
MGNGQRSRPPGPGPAPGGSQPPAQAGFKPVVRTVPLQAVPLQIPAPRPATSVERAPAAPRPFIEEAPYVAAPRHVAPVDDSPTEHPAAALLRQDPRLARVAPVPARSASRIFAVAALAAVLVGAGAAVLVFGLRATSATQGVPSASVNPVSSAAAPAAAGEPASASAVAGSTSSSRAPADPSATSVTPDAPPPSPTSQPLDTSALLSFEGLLTVTSSSDAEVVLQGVSVGRTNRPLRVRCGPRNVRLRASSGAWLTPGLATSLPCMQATTIALEPQR